MTSILQTTEMYEASRTCYVFYCNYSHTILQKEGCMPSFFPKVKVYESSETSDEFQIADKVEVELYADDHLYYGLISILNICSRKKCSSSIPLVTFHLIFCFLVGTQSLLKIILCCMPTQKACSDLLQRNIISSSCRNHQVLHRSVHVACFQPIISKPMPCIYIPPIAASPQ